MYKYAGYLLKGHSFLLPQDQSKFYLKLFPQGFNFVMARQLFDAWLLQSADTYSEQEINAMWIGFAHQICDLYYKRET